MILSKNLQSHFNEALSTWVLILAVALFFLEVVWHESSEREVPPQFVGNVCR